MTANHRLLNSIWLQFIVNILKKCLPVLLLHGTVPLSLLASMQVHHVHLSPGDFWFIMHGEVCQEPDRCLEPSCPDNSRLRFQQVALVIKAWERGFATEFGFQMNRLNFEEVNVPLFGVTAFVKRVAGCHWSQRKRAKLSFALVGWYHTSLLVVYVLGNCFWIIHS